MMPETKDITATRRNLIQNARLAIRDVLDAIVELVTNADDRYQILGEGSTIEIEVERRRGDRASLLRIRDFADGMTGEAMDRKLSRTGERVSGLERGKAVRGTNSRGAKDICALGHLTFESIAAADDRYHKCEITPFFEFIAHRSRQVTPAIRRRVGIQEGTGTLVTLEIEPKHAVPRYDTLLAKLERLVPLRNIVRDPHRNILLRDLNKGREDLVRPPKIAGKNQLKESFEVPGYPGTKAKLFVRRAKRRLERALPNLRLGGFLVESRRAIHEATLFDSALERDPHAAWFFGRLVCDAIDDLCTEYDDYIEEHRDPPAHNPVPLVDPSRRGGLTREHPFTKALFEAVLIRLRPLVEEERRRAEREKDSIESRATRRRLEALERAAAKFMKDSGDEDLSTGPDRSDPNSSFTRLGFLLSPPFAQLLLGHSRIFTLSVSQQAHPAIRPSATVRVSALTPDLRVEQRAVRLESQPGRADYLSASWRVRAMLVSPATGIRAEVEQIAATSTVEVLESHADLYSDVDDLQFRRSRYRMKVDSVKRNIELLAPLSMFPEPVRAEIHIDDPSFDIVGETNLRPEAALGIARCKLSVAAGPREARAALSATAAGCRAEAHIESVTPLGSRLEIRIEDIDLEHQRYRWRQNVLEIAARHPSLSRYLGSREAGFPGQETRHFRLLLGEIVAEAVCSKLLERQEQASPEAFDGANWIRYYTDFSRLMTAFLPVSHALVLPNESLPG